jgi:hypothetical protein
MGSLVLASGVFNINSLTSKGVSREVYI